LAVRRQSDSRTIQRSQLERAQVKRRDRTTSRDRRRRQAGADPARFVQRSRPLMSWGTSAIPGWLGQSSFETAISRRGTPKSGIKRDDPIQRRQIAPAHQGSRTGVWRRRNVARSPGAASWVSRERYSVARFSGVQRPPPRDKSVNEQIAAPAAPPVAAASPSSRRVGAPNHGSNLYCSGTIAIAARALAGRPLGGRVASRARWRSAARGAQAADDRGVPLSMRGGRGCGRGMLRG
jgi:hypothetical protein